MQDRASASRHQENFNESIIANDADTLKDIYAANFPAIERYILANQGTSDDAKDIYQEAFLVLWRNIQLGRFVATHRGSAGGYLMQVARRKWIDVLRKEKKMRFSEIKENHEANVAPVDEHTEEDRYLDLVKKHYSSMGQPCKELLYRFYFRKERLREIAAYFSWTEPTAKNNKYRCLQKLRNAVLKAI